MRYCKKKINSHILVFNTLWVIAIIYQKLYYVVKFKQTNEISTFYYAQHTTRTNFSSSYNEKNKIKEKISLSYNYWELNNQVNEILVETNLHINTEQIECKVKYNCHHALQECF